MAKSSKSKARKPKTDEQIIDAIEVPEAVGDFEAEVIQGVEDPEVQITEEPPEEQAEEPIDEHTQEADLPAEPALNEKSNDGFIPLLLGGVAAGAIGYGVAIYFPMSSASSDLADQIAAQAEQIAALEAQVSGLPSVDMTAVETQIGTVAEQSAAAIDTLTDSVSSQFADVDARLLEVEKRPGADGTLSDTALAAYQRELEDLRAELDASQENVMSAAAQAEADLAEARAEAARLEAEAVEAAEAAAARAALNRIAVAVETGAPFAGALADLDGADVPVALSSAATSGVATTAELVDTFPAAARAALATARAEGLSDDAGGLGGFLRSQFDVRSTAPQEGAGPDAVLSRAEAAVKEGRVADALAELEALPEVARAKLNDWTARATELSDVLDAIATLSETYN